MAGRFVARNKLFLSEKARTQYELALIDGHMHKELRAHIVPLIDDMLDHYELEGGARAQMFQLLVKEIVVR